jgi:hypothetical protein
MGIRIRYSLYFILFITFSFAISFGCNKLTRGFRAANITKASSFDSRWQPLGTSYLEDPLEIEKALSSPFYFLDTGGSAYVFRSADNKYVIKFFKAHRLCPPKWTSSKLMTSLIPLGAQHVINRKEYQKTLQFSSYRLSLDTIPHQTGVVYLHLNPTTHHKKTITLYDNIGVKHTVSADETAFVMQKKAIRFAPYFKKLLAKNEMEEAKALLTTFAGFLKERADKGIRDGDITPRNNLGMLGHSLVIFDIDQLRTKNLSATKLEHMLKDAKEMFLWLKNKNKELIIYLKDEIARLASESEDAPHE